ncbi:MAG: hypothetical protein EOO66_31930, partial [Methylobacterium sp.]
MRPILTLFATAAALVASPVLAQSQTAPANPPTPDTNRNRITVGLGVASLPDYEGARDNDWTPGAVVIGTVRGHDFFTRGTQLYV